MTLDATVAQRATTSIRVEGVSKTFGGRRGVTALSDVSFDVPDGGFVSIIGPSGCGKSTLLRLISGLQPVTSGSIVLGDDRTPAQMRRDREFGIVFQSPCLFDWRTVAQNVALPLQVMGRSKQEIRSRVTELLELVGLTDFADHHPWQLSGGMQQRVSIARALTFAPRFLLMDEPFGALDMMTRERMGTELLRIWGERPGTSVLFITHSVSEAVLLSDRVVVMSSRPGRVLEVIDVDLPRPRADAIRQTKAFNEIEGHLRELIFSQEYS